MKPVFWRKFALLNLVFLSFLTATSAQKKVFEDILAVTLKNSGAIAGEGTDVAGYYFFYETAKVEKGERKYQLQLLDKNLEKVGQKSFTGSKSMSLSEGAYNGKNLAIKLVDAKEETITLRILDGKGESLSSKKLDYGVFDNPKYASTGSSASGMNDQRLFGVPGGFVYYSMEPRKGVMSQTDYSIRFLPEAEGSKGWTVRSAANSEDFEMASFVAADERVLLSTVIKRPNFLSKDLEYYVLAIDMATGKKLYEKTLEDTKYALTVNNAWLNKGQIRFFGEYYNKEEKTMKASSLGLCTFTMDETGQIQNRQYISWAKDVARFLPSNEKGKVEDVGYLYFHDFIPMPDGKVHAVAESYRKAVDGLGVASQLLSGGGGASSSKVVVEDFYFFEFSSDFTLENVRFFEKYKSSVALPSGGTYMGAQMMGYVTNYLGGFDYAFTQNEDDLFTIGYLDFEKRKGEKNGFIYGAISYADNAFTTDKIMIDSEADNFRILPAQPGFVFVMEYYRKAKRLDARLEKIKQ